MKEVYLIMLLACHWGFSIESDISSQEKELFAS